MKTSTIAIALTLSLATMQGAWAADKFPNRPVKVINPFPAGSGPDAVARLVGDKLGKAWGQPLVIENRPGGNGFIAMEATKRAAPTGYELGVADVGHMAINPSLFKQLPYNPVTDYAPVSVLYRTSFFVLVSQQSNFKTLQDLISAAKQSPGKITYGSWAVGSPGHLGAAQLESVTGTRMLHVPFKDTAQLYAAVANNDVSWALGSLATAGPLIQAGKLRVLAVADQRRSPVLPDTPTVKEAGATADIDASTWVALLAPAGTPPAIVEQINKDVATALDSPDVREKMATFGFVPAAGKSADLAALIRTDIPRYAQIIKRSGVAME
jgi:tripartite-type tricarboxylate transporter receptor subunit TctC